MSNASPQVKITEFTKIDSTFNPHVEFKVEFGSHFHFKRYSEFEKLDAYLRQRYDNLVPFLPPKKYLGRFDTIFLRIRQIVLEWYLNELLDHPVLKLDGILDKFLTSAIVDIPIKKALSSNSLLNLFKSAPKYFEQDDRLRIIAGQASAIKSNYENLTSHVQIAVESLNDSLQVLGKLKKNMQLFGVSNLHTHPKLSKRSACMSSIFSSLIEINESRMNADQRLLAVLQISQGQMDAVQDLVNHRKRDQEALATALQPNSGQNQREIEECKLQLEKIGDIIKIDVDRSEYKRAQLVRRVISKILLELIECQRKTVIQWESYNTEIKRKSSTAPSTQQQFLLGSDSDEDNRNEIFKNVPFSPASEDEHDLSTAANFEVNSQASSAADAPITPVNKDRDENFDITQSSKTDNAVNNPWDQ